MALNGVCWWLARFAFGVRCRESAVGWLWRVSDGGSCALPPGFDVGKARWSGFGECLMGVTALCLRVSGYLGEWVLRVSGGAGSEL